MSTPAIPMTACKSSNIAAHGYDAASRTLEVQFTNGARYQYHDVPPEVADGFTQAESVGKFFTQSVRGQFKHSPIADQERTAD